MSEPKCQYCARALLPDARFCQQCGKSVQTSTIKGYFEKKPEELPLYRPRMVITTWLVPFNNSVAFGQTLVGIYGLFSLGLMDLLSPRVNALPWAAGFMLFALLLVLSLRSKAASRWPLTQRLLPLLQPDRPLWKSRLVLAAGLLALMSLTGAAWSKANAVHGGVIASSSQAARSFQSDFLGLHQDLQVIEQGLNKANQTLDLLAAASQNPHKEVVAKGYSFDSKGLALAIEQGNTEAVALFAERNLPVTDYYPLLQAMAAPWKPELMDLLTPAMFVRKQACMMETSSYPMMQFVYVKDHYAERAQLYKRLCKTGDEVAYRWTLEKIKREIDTLEQQLAREREAQRPLSRESQEKQRMFLEISQTLGT